MHTGGTEMVKPNAGNQSENLPEVFQGYTPMIKSMIREEERPNEENLF